MHLAAGSGEIGAMLLLLRNGATPNEVDANLRAHSALHHVLALINPSRSLAVRLRPELLPGS